MGDSGEVIDSTSSMSPVAPRILTINAGSSSIRFTLFEAGRHARRPGRRRWPHGGSDCP